VLTLLYDARGTEGVFGDRDVEASSLQRLGVRQRGFRRLFPLFPSAVERLPVAAYDLVVSSSSAFAHGVRTRPGATHVCYCHTPFRYAWHERIRAEREVPAPARPLLRILLARQRRWDVAASRRVTSYVANSEITRQRIADSYGRESVVIHPPVDVARFRPGEPEDFLLCVTELVAHKRVDVAAEAASRAGLPLKVVGEGPDAGRLRALYGDSVDFLGRVPDQELEALYPRCLALIVPNVEEFGIAAVEAMAAGRPVVAAAAGGALETVIDGETGVLVPPGSSDALAEVLRESDFTRFSANRIRENAERFSTDAFRRRFRDHVDSAVARQAPAASR